MSFNIKKIMSRRIILSLLLFALTCGVAGAVTYEEAKDMYRAGDYAGALPVFKKRLKDRPKDAALNHWVGVCLMYTGNPSEAIPYLEFAHKKKITEAPRYLAEIAFMDYRADDAAEYMDAYKEALAKDKKKMSEDATFLDDKIGKMQAMLDRVEQIEIIDSVAVDAETFLKFYKLSSESGSINSRDVLPADFEAAPLTIVYMPESKNTMTWAMPDENDNYVLVGSSRLSDGKWEKPHRLGDNLNDGGDANYPFLLSDGITMYFANDGENSLGGYDIFISRRDENEFLQPQNIGMPYNSPYNDYMFAIDEFTGVGWWATDRGRDDGMVTIYKFIPKEMRENYSVDEPNLRNLAKITSYRDTWVEGADYTDKLAEIEDIGTIKKVKKSDFEFEIPGRGIYRTWDEFQNPVAREAMEGYLDARNKQEADKKRLEELRRQYALGGIDHSDEILSLEKNIRIMRDRLIKMSNRVIELELNN